MIPIFFTPIKSWKHFGNKKKTLRNANCLSLSCYSLLQTCQEKYIGDLVSSNYIDMYKCDEL
jgi:hypothetical protein